MKLTKEFSTYNPKELAVKYIAEVLQRKGKLHLTQAVEEEKVY